MRHTISVLVENKPGVLAKISGLFSRRGYNIDSLSVGPTEDPTVSRMTIVVNVEDKSIEQITKQLHKLINVIKIQDLDPNVCLDRELALIKVNTEPNYRPEIIEIADIFRAKIVDVSLKSLVVEITGTEDKIKAIIELLSPYGILELARAGKVAISRGNK
jgi:acetolactate synthase-1/3 small subunit